MDAVDLFEASLKAGRSVVLWGFGYGRQLRDAWEAGKAGDPGADYYASRLGRAEDGGEALEPRSAHLGPYTAEEVFALRDDAWDHRPPPCGKHWPKACDCYPFHFHRDDDRRCWCPTPTLRPDLETEYCEAHDVDDTCWADDLQADYDAPAAPVGAPTPNPPTAADDDKNRGGCRSCYGAGRVLWAGGSAKCSRCKGTGDEPTHDLPAGDASPPSPAGTTPGEYAAVAVLEVLAAHVPSVDSQGVYCDGLDSLTHAHFDDWFDWREHVAAEVSRRINAAAVDARVTDRLDAAGFAKNTFEQHRKT